MKQMSIAAAAIPRFFCLDKNMVMVMKNIVTERIICFWCQKLVGVGSHEYGIEYLDCFKTSRQSSNVSFSVKYVQKLHARVKITHHISCIVLHCVPQMLPQILPQKCILFGALEEQKTALSLLSISCLRNFTVKLARLEEHLTCCHPPARG